MKLLAEHEKSYLRSVRIEVLKEFDVGLHRVAVTEEGHIGLKGPEREEYLVDPDDIDSKVVHPALFWRIQP